MTTAMMALSVVLTTFAADVSIGPKVNPTMVAKKTALKPPVGAKPSTSIGRTGLQVSTANGSNQDSFWIERIDIDGDGDVEESELLWDREDKVLYAFTTSRFGCKNGGTAPFNLLVAAYGDGNSHNKPAKSGFWVADLDKGECGVPLAGLFGCRFDANGAPTVCGAATIDQVEDDLLVVPPRTD